MYDFKYNINHRVLSVLKKNLNNYKTPFYLGPNAYFI